MANIYCSSAKYALVTAWAPTTVLVVGDVRRQLTTPAVDSERCFRVSAITTGITGAVEPTWVITANGNTTSGGVTFTECTGQAGFNGDGGGTAWGAPHARIQNALAATWAVSDDNVFVGPTHAETKATALSWLQANSGTASLPIKVVCVDDTTVPPTTRATGATVTQSSNTLLSVQCKGLYVYGISFITGTGASASNLQIGNNAASGTTCNHHFESCFFKIVNTASSSRIQIGMNSTTNTRAQYFKFTNCTWELSNVSQKIAFGSGMVDFVGGSMFATGTVPTAGAWEGSIASGSLVAMKGVDLSTIAAGNALLNVAVTSNFLDLSLVNCIISASVGNLSGTSVSPVMGRVRRYNCSDATENYSFSQNDLGISMSHITTKYANTGANNGSSSFSALLIGGGQTGGVAIPPKVFEMRAWNSAVGSSVTATIEINGTSPTTDREVWMEVDYPNSATTPVISTVNSRTSDLILGAATANTTSLETWTGTALGNPEKLVCTFTPQQAGLITARVYCLNQSDSYIDPKLRLS